VVAGKVTGNRIFGSPGKALSARREAGSLWRNRSPAVPDEPDPPRKTYGFKPREFKRDNVPAAEAGAMPTARELAKVATEGVPPQKTERRGPKTDDPNDVYATLQLNRAAEQGSGGDELKTAPKFNYRRKRDYWLLLLPIEAVFGTVALLARHNLGILFGALAAMALTFVILTWIMWLLMDRY
jgi:hypothetical protein